MNFHLPDIFKARYLRVAGLYTTPGCHPDEFVERGQADGQGQRYFDGLLSAFQVSSLIIQFLINLSP